MKAKEQTLAELLDGAVVHVTPSFQRAYGGPDDVVAPLVGAAASARPAGASALLGALVTRELAGAGGVRKCLLIDGNQRLATMLLILLALRDALRGPHPSEAAALDAACFLNVGAPAPLRFKYLAAKADRAAFEAAAEGRPPPDPAHPMARTFAKAAAAFAALDPEELPALARRLPGAFGFVVFAMASDDDPYPVFRLFNTRDDRLSRIGGETYRRFAADPELMDLVAGGESQEVEFKAHAVVPSRDAKSRGGPHDVGTVVRAVAAMLNSATGGTLLVGVEDDGAICGVEGEYALADRGKPNWVPESVFSDSRKTYFQLPSAIGNTDDMPTVYILRDGRQNLVNYRQVGNILVVDSIIGGNGQCWLLKQSEKEQVRVYRK